jgi:hypothetical protein
MKSYEVTDLCFFFSARMAKSATISVFSSSFATVALWLHFTQIISNDHQVQNGVLFTVRVCLPDATQRDSLHVNVYQLPGWKIPISDGWAERERDRERETETENKLIIVINKTKIPTSVILRSS